MSFALKSHLKDLKKVKKIKESELHLFLQEVKQFLATLCNHYIILILLRAIVLQTDSPNGRIDNTTFRVDSPTKPILAVFSPESRWSYSSVRLSIWWSRPVFRKSYFL